jgi:hypothetical protein
MQSSENICAICQECDGKMTKTPCNHFFHIECLKNIRVPKCPLCKKNISYFLIKNGLSKNKIKNRINENNFFEVKNAVLQNEALNEYDEYDMSMLLIYCITTNNKWKETIKNMIISSFSNSYDLFTKSYQHNWNNNNKGVYTIYCDLSTILENIMENYNSSLLQWIDIETLVKNQSITQMVNNIKKESNNNSIDFAVIVIIDNDIYGGNYIYSHKFKNKENNQYKFPNKKEILESLLSFNPYQLQMAEIPDKNIESVWINNYYYDLLNGILTMEIYDTFKESLLAFEKHIIKICNNLEYDEHKIYDSVLTVTYACKGIQTIYYCMKYDIVMKSFTYNYDLIKKNKVINKNYCFDDLLLFLENKVNDRISFALRILGTNKNYVSLFSIMKHGDDNKKYKFVKFSKSRMESALNVNFQTGKKILSKDDIIVYLD